MQGWVKNWRSIKEWDWYKKPKTSHLFQHLIREANHKDKTWQGELVKRGSIITGLHSLSEKTGLTISEIRTAFKHLSITSDIAIKSTQKYSVISITNYDKYQGDDKQISTQDDKQVSKVLTTNKNVRKKKEEIESVFDFEPCYALYPKKEGKKKGFEKLKSQIKSQDQFDLFLKAVKNYAQQIENEQTTRQYIKQFSSFVGVWEDYTEQGTEKEINNFTDIFIIPEEKA